MSFFRAASFALGLVVVGVGLRAVPHVIAANQSSSRYDAGVATGSEPSASAPRSDPRKVAAVVFEAVLVTAAGTVVLMSPAFAAPLSAGPPALRVLSLTLVGCFVIGLFGGSPRVSFPFLPWRMYAGTPAHPPFICRVVLESAEQPSLRIDLDAAVPVLAPRRLDHLLRAQVAELQRLARGAADWERAWRIHSETLRALAALYERQHPGAAWERIVVHGGVVSAEDVERFPAMLPRLWEVVL